MVTGRFAPSPSGPLHLGSLRTALLSWLFARHEGGRWLIRVEDLDQAAARHASEQLDDLASLGLLPDDPPVLQSSRRARHDEAIDALVEFGMTYPCYCTRREIAEATQAPHGPATDGAYPGTCRDLGPDERAERQERRPPALRLRTDGAHVDAVDELLGDIGGVVDDFVIRRNDGTPAYNLAVVVDDSDQGIDQVVRGDDLAETTRRQVLVARLLGLTVPTYAHVPLVLGPTGGRLAKRDGAVTLGDRLAAGSDPAEVLALLAWSLGLAGPEESVTLETVLERFDPAGVPRTPWRLGPDGL